MEEQILNFIGISIFLGIPALALISILIRAVKNMHAPVQTVHAEVIDKHVIKNFSKHAPTGYRKKYVVVFSVNGKKKSFYVSQFSYNGYRVREKGSLTYKGDRLIDFH